MLNIAYIILPDTNEFHMAMTVHNTDVLQRLAWHQTLEPSPTSNPVNKEICIVKA